MNGWILYVGEMVTELRRGIDEAAARGIRIDVVHPKDVDVVLDTGSADVYVKGKAVPLPSFVVAGFIEENDAYNLALLQNLEAMGALCLNTAQALQNTGDKLRTHQLLAAHGIPCPKTVLIRRGMKPEDLLVHLQIPLVIKAVHGSKGAGVVLVKSRQELDNLLQTMTAGHMREDFIAQEYIADSHGKDIRILVINRKPAVAMLRTAATPEQFKSNVSQGGTVQAWEITEDMRILAQQVIDVIGLNMGGIDLLFTSKGYVVCEANSIPGFQGIEKCCPINVPEALFRSIGLQLAVRKKSPIQMNAFFRDMRQKGVLETLTGVNELESLAVFRSMCDYPREMQQLVLMDILRRNGGCEFGLTHHFEQIKDESAYREAVPLSEWPDYETSNLRMQKGGADILFAGKRSILCSPAERQEPPSIFMKARPVRRPRRSPAICAQHP